MKNVYGTFEKTMNNDDRANLPGFLTKQFYSNINEEHFCEVAMLKVADISNSAGNYALGVNDLEVSSERGLDDIEHILSVMRVQNEQRRLEDEAEKARKQDIIEKRAAEDRALFERMSRRMRSSEGAFRCQKAGTNSSRCGVDLSGYQRSHIFAASMSVGNHGKGFDYIVPEAKTTTSAVAVLPMDDKKHYEGFELNGNMTFEKFNGIKENVYVSEREEHVMGDYFESKCNFDDSACKAVTEFGAHSRKKPANVRGLELRAELSDSQVSSLMRASENRVAQSARYDIAEVCDEVKLLSD